MNAPAFITDPRVAAYAPQVSAFMPGVCGRELELRCRLLMARDTASAALTRCSDAEAGLMAEIQCLGMTYAFAPLPTPALELLLEAQRLMMRAAAPLGRFADALGEEVGARG